MSMIPSSKLGRDSSLESLIQEVVVMGLNKVPSKFTSASSFNRQDVIRMKRSQSSQQIHVKSCMSKP